MHSVSSFRSGKQKKEFHNAVCIPSEIKGQNVSRTFQPPLKTLAAARALTVCLISAKVAVLVAKAAS